MQVRSFSAQPAHQRKKTVMFVCKRNSCRSQASKPKQAETVTTVSCCQDKIAQQLFSHVQWEMTEGYKVLLLLNYTMSCHSLYFIIIGGCDND